MLSSTIQDFNLHLNIICFLCY